MLMPRWTDFAQAYPPEGHEVWVSCEDGTVFLAKITWTAARVRDYGALAWKLAEQRHKAEGRQDKA